MIRENSNLIVELFDAIEADWALCDEKDDDEHMVLVNENSDEHQTLKPPKSLVSELEKEGYIRLDEEKSDTKEMKREYMNFLEETIPVAFLYFYEITKKGKELYAEYRNS